MSTPDNRSVNFFSLFRRGQHYSKTWPLEKRLAPVFVENRVIKMTRYAIPFYAADRRIYSLLADCPGRSAWAGSCHCAGRLKFTHAGIVVAGQAFCNAITSCNPQLVL